MKCVSFNVNSVRLRLHQLAAVIDTHDPDVIGLQETKVADDAFPAADIESLGYHAVWFGQKTHYGVALLSKTPPSAVTRGFDGDAEDAQRRMIAATIRSPSGTDIRVMNGYFPQGESRNHDVKFPAKRAFYANLLHQLQNECDPGRPLVVMGDFNVAPHDTDIGIGADGIRRWLRTGSCSFLPEEREWFEMLRDWGLSDSYRCCHPERDDRFSWFDYRSRGFDRDPKRGLRIDHIMSTAVLSDNLRDAGIDYEVRAMEKPSDHCPVWADYEL